MYCQGWRYLEVRFRQVWPRVGCMDDIPLFLRYSKIIKVQDRCICELTDHTADTAVSFLYDILLTNHTYKDYNYIISCKRRNPLLARGSA
mgnify:CR=1 FL=1